MREGQRTRARVCTLAYAVLAFLLAIPLYAQPAGLSPGDWIDVGAAQVPGLSGRYQVNQDGAIEFPVVGSVAVAGTSLQALREQLQDKLANKGYQTPIAIELEAGPARAEALPTAVMEDTRLLQSGDVLAIQVIGEPTVSGQYTVRPTGTIILPMAGEIPVRDLTPEELTGVITQRLKRYVIEPVVSVNLLGAIPRLVSIVGQVSRPGLYPIDQTPTALALLSAAGGVLPNGDLSAAMLFRDGSPQKLAPEGLLTGGILRNDVPLKKGDTLVIPQSPPTVVLVVGAVQNPGAIPLEQAHNLSRAILLAGGPTEAADPAQAYILRGTERIDVDLRDVMGDNPGGGEASSSAVALQPDDVIVVPPGTGREPVYVIGAVNAPGPKLAKNAGSLSEAIVVSGGITKEADLTAAYILREGHRLEADLETLIEQGQPSADLALQPGDAVVVPSTVKQVYVAGWVTSPGAYPSEQAKTVLELWSLVGSALPDGNLRNCIILRGDETISVDIEALVNQGDMSQNVALRPGDKVVVPEIQERVYVLGQVARPGPYPIKEGETLMDMLGKAGGPTIMANISKIVLMRRPGAEVVRQAPSRRMQTVRTEPGRAGRSGRALQQPAFGIESFLERKRGRIEERPVPPKEAKLPAKEHVSLQILAAAQWEDTAMRPRPGDVIYVPARREALTGRDYERMLLGIGSALLIGRRIW